MRREIAQELERERAEKDRLMKKEIEDLRNKLSQTASLTTSQVIII